MNVKQFLSISMTINSGKRIIYFVEQFLYSLQHLTVISFKYETRDWRRLIFLSAIMQTKLNSRLPTGPGNFPHYNVMDLRGRQLSTLNSFRPRDKCDAQQFGNKLSWMHTARHLCTCYSTSVHFKTWGRSGDICDGPLVTLQFMFAQVNGDKLHKELYSMRHFNIKLMMIL